jgi:hypothetical protein
VARSRHLDIPLEEGLRRASSIAQLTPDTDDAKEGVKAHQRSGPCGCEWTFPFYRSDERQTDIFHVHEK